ncbi:hypothetical protein [Microcystis phage MJing1]|nr:hypothetical protein [Microcystis phage MJing1]
MPRLSEPEERLLREMVDGKDPKGGFASDIGAVQRMLGEIDHLRQEIWRLGHPYGPRDDGGHPMQIEQAEDPLA